MSDDPYMSICSLKSLEEMRAEFREYKGRMHQKKKYVKEARKELLGLWRLSRREKRDVWSDLSNLNSNIATSNVNGSTIKAAFRAYISTSQEGRCCYCRQWLVSTAYAKPIEHILPRDTYPHFSLYFWNLAVACADCNGIKSNASWQNGLRAENTYPEPKAFNTMFHPRFHAYNEHVQYVTVETNNSSISLYKGISKQGKALCLNLLEKVAAKRTFMSRNDSMRKSISTLDSYREMLDISTHPMLEKFIRSLDDSLAHIVDGARQMNKK